MFPDDNHLRGTDKLDDLMKASIFAHFQTMPVPLSMFSQLNLANDLSKHSKLSDRHRYFNLQNIVESHGMDPIQCLTLFFGKIITNSIYDGQFDVTNFHDGSKHTMKHVLSDICKLLFYFIK